VFQKKKQIFAHDKFGTVCHKMKIFAPQCSAEIAVYQSMQNFCKLIKYSF